MVNPILNAAPGNKPPVPTLLTAVMAALLAGCSTLGGGGDELIDQAPISDISFSDDDEIDFRGAAVFDRRVYGTIGTGASRLEPNTEQANGISVDDEFDPAGQIALGADLSNTFSVELHSANLGSAKLDPTGRVGYDVNGGSVLLYAGKQRGERRGLMGYGRAGLATSDIEAIGDVTVTTDDEVQGIVGAGLEYMGSNLGIRGEVIVFDKDAQFAQLGVIYRLGNSGGGTEELPESLPPVRLPAPTAPPVSEPPVPQPPVTGELPEELPPLNELPPLQELPPLPDAERTTTIDQDADGIPDALDTCPATDPGMEVDDSGCAIFNGIIDGVNFERGSDRLTIEAQAILDGVIDTLRQHPDAMIAIAAHTDSRGREEDNLALSRDRAISVARYMITRGVPKALMSARAFGEYQPIADNDTAEGRAQNRRVEIVASKQP